MRTLRAPIALAALVALIASGGAAVGSSARSTPATYTVRRGDTLSAIAHRMHVDLATLTMLNRATVPDPDRIWPGQVLALRGSAPAPVVAAKAAAAAQPARQAPLSTAVVVITPKALTHVVRPGESLAVIAAQWHTTAAALAAANGLRVSSTLRVGTTLTLTSPPYLCPVQGKRSYIDSWGFPRTGHKHEGNDIMSPRGTPVVAPVGGVLEQRHGPVGGNAFYIHGDDGNTYYGAHLDAFTALAGPIARGQQIGIVGDTGDAKGGATHLHFEVHPGNGTPVDPYFTLKAWGC